MLSEEQATGRCGQDGEKPKERGRRRNGDAGETDQRHCWWRNTGKLGASPSRAEGAAMARGGVSQVGAQVGAVPRKEQAAGRRGWTGEKLETRGRRRNGDGSAGGTGRRRRPKGLQPKKLQEE